MSGPTKIEWADFTWSPVTGCTKVSAGCAHCYAERQAKRFAGRAGYPVKDPFAVTLHPDRLDEPLHWRKPRRIFVCSMGDLFHPDVPDDFVDRVWGAMMLAHWHQFLVLTKRPERMKSYLDRKFKRGPVVERLCAFYADDPRLAGVWPLTGERAAAAAHWPLPNVWLGTSVEDQATADERIPHLLRCPAAVRFISYEPALAAVDLGAYLISHEDNGLGWDDFGKRVGASSLVWTPALDWVIAGGESGPKARPAHPDWFRSVRRQCQAAGVPFFLKQHGEWASRASGMPRAALCETYRRGYVALSGRFVGRVSWAMGLLGGEEILCEDGCEPVWRVGKKAAGRLLDGVEHNDYPGKANP